MSNKTRKGIRPGFLAATLGVVAMLAVLAAVMLPSGSAQAQGAFVDTPTNVVARASDDGSQVTVTWSLTPSVIPAAGYEVERATVDPEAPFGTLNFGSLAAPHTSTERTYTDASVMPGETYVYQVRTNTARNLNSDWVESNRVMVTAPTIPMPGDRVHAPMPKPFWAQALDNGARLNWGAPDMEDAEGVEVIGYRILRDAWNAEPMHPINQSGDIAFNVIDTKTQYFDLGLAYETVYTYRVQAIVEYDVKRWWNNLDCPMMNAVVSPNSDEPQVVSGASSPYCHMYDDLSEAAKVVVGRAYDKYDEMYPTYMSYNRYALGELSRMATIETADSGGRLQPLLDPPTAIKNLRLSDSCADSIVVTWEEPDYFGTVPATDADGVYVGPDYIGGTIAGLEEVGEDATSVHYEVQRRVNSGSWASVSYTGMMYTDNDVAYGSTYEYRVRAVNPHGLKSNWVAMRMTLTVPDGVNAPSNLRATINEEGDVVLQWTAPMGGNQSWFNEDMSDPQVGNGDLSKRLSYRIERVDANNNDAGNFGMPTQAHRYGPRSFNDPRITHEQTYKDEYPHDGLVTYVVTALVDACLPSDGNSVSLDTQIGEPGAPGNVNAMASGNSVEVTWSAPASAGSLGDITATITGYNVERSAMSGSGFTAVATGHSGTSYTDSGLSYGETYYYRVIAVNSFGASSQASAEASAMTAMETLGTVTGVSSQGGINTGGTVQVSWTGVSNAQSYIIIAINVADTAGDRQSQFIGEGATTGAVSGLTSGETYNIFVAALGAGNQNTLSDPIRVTAN